MRSYKCLDTALQQAWFRVTTVAFPLVATEQQVLEQLETRLSFKLSLQGQNIWWTRPAKLGNIQGGIYRSSGTSGDSSLDLYLALDGGMVKANWFAYQSLTNVPMWIVECIGPPMTSGNSYEDSVTW
jgi:hypothetical protein